MKAVNGIFMPEYEVHFAECPTLGAMYPSLIAALPHVAQRRTAVDVGAHIGLWSRWLQQEFADVYAFEPVAEFAKIFRKNVSGKNVRILNNALGDTFRRVAMKINPADTGQAHIVGNGHIPLWPLDCYRLQEVDLIKIDVEGYELPVLKGAEKTLRLCKPVVIIEQRGLDVVNFKSSEPDQATIYLKNLGMTVLDEVDSDRIMGW